MSYQAQFFLFLFVILCSADIGDMKCGPFPHIDNKPYLQHLTNHVEKNVDMFRVMVIVGPKDAGKSEGLSTMQAKWENKSYLVIEINLKGESHIISGKEVMSKVSKEMSKKLGLFSYITYWQLYSKTIETCLDPNATIWGWITSSIQYIITIILGTVSMIVGINCRNFLNLIRRFYKDYHCLFCILMVIAFIFTLLFVCFFVILWKNPTFIYMILQPYDTEVKNGDWTSLICFLNVIATIQPYHKPILIIKEVINMENQCLQECMRSLEQAKEFTTQ